MTPDTLLTFLQQCRGAGQVERFWYAHGYLVGELMSRGYTLRPDEVPIGPGDVWRQRLEAETLAAEEAFGPDVPDAAHRYCYRRLQPPD